MLWGWDSSVHINIHLHNGEFSSEPLTTSIQWKLKAHWDLLRQSFMWELVRIITMLVKKKKQLSRKINGLKRIFMPNFFFRLHFNLKKRSNASNFSLQIVHPITKSIITFLSKSPCTPCTEQWANNSLSNWKYLTNSLPHLQSQKVSAVSIFSIF